jgi:hypothetical protein
LNLPSLTTSPPEGDPDIGPGMGQARDRDLDAEARHGMTTLPAAGESEGERDAAADLDASIQCARDVVLTGKLQPVLPVLVDPLDALRRLV